MAVIPLVSQHSGVHSIWRRSSRLRLSTTGIVDAPNTLMSFVRCAGSPKRTRNLGARNGIYQLTLIAVQRIAHWDALPECFLVFPRDAIAALGGCVRDRTDHRIATMLLSLRCFAGLDETGGACFLALDSGALANLQIIDKETHCLLYGVDRCERHSASAECSSG